MNDPLLSVCLITYNHGKFIKQAIEGVLAQKTNFKFELIIADDFSTDGTRDILREYKSRHPEFIRLILQEKNVGAAKNWTDLITLPVSKYIAYFEGDDYWIDPLKLQKQVDFLEGNPDYSICFHDVLFKIGNRKYRNYQWDAPVDSDLTYLLKRGNYLVAASIVYRNHPDIVLFIQKFPDAQLGDYLLYVSVAQRGKLRFIRDKMAVYRVHTGGTWSQLSIEKAFLKCLALLEMLHDDLEDPYKDYLKIQLLAMLEVMLRVKGDAVILNNPVLERLFTKMQIPPFLVEYLKFSSVEKSKASYYSKNIPFPVLLSAVREKIKNRIFRF